MISQTCFTIRQVLDIRDKDIAKRTVLEDRWKNEREMRMMYPFCNVNNTSLKPDVLAMLFKVVPPMLKTEASEIPRAVIENFCDQNNISLDIKMYAPNCIYNLRTEQIVTTDDLDTIEDDVQ